MTEAPQLTSDSFQHAQNMSCVITSPDAVSPQWLTQSLRRGKCLPHGRVARVHVTSESSYTSTIARLTLAYSSDAPSTAPVRLFLKLSRSDSEQRVVGSDQRRAEVVFHNQLATTMPDPPLVRCHDAAYCQQTGAAHLLFDDVSQTHSPGSPTLPPAPRQAQSAMDAFARFHAFWWDHRRLGEIDQLPSEESVAERVANTREHFARFTDAAGDRLTHPQRQVYARSLAALPALWQRVIPGTHLSLIHGDANFSNVLLPHHPDNGRAMIIDWQLYGISFPAEDLAHLIPLFWDREHRQAMERDLLQRYHQQLIRHAVQDYDWTDCWEDYRRAVVLRALFMPMWFCLSGSPESWWHACLGRAMQAVDDLHCLELPETK